MEQAKAQLPTWAGAPYDRFAAEVVEGLVDQVQEHHNTRPGPANDDDPCTLAVRCDAQERIVAVLQDAYAAGLDAAQAARGSAQTTQ